MPQVTEHDVIPMLIGADWTVGAGSEKITVIDPATGESFGRVPQATDSEVFAAVESAYAAHRDRRWSGLSPAARRDVLIRLAQLIDDDKAEIAALETKDMGKPIERSLGDIALAIDGIRYYSGAPQRLRGQSQPTGDGTVIYGRREPVGVAALILPWNFPFMTAAWKLAAALAAGCTVVMKPAEQTPMTTLRLAALALEAGVPEGVINVVTGDGRTGAALVAHPRVAAVSFTGSTEVGRKIMISAAATLKKLTLELGGKNANIVFDDADLDAAVTMAIRASFGHSGQMCTAGSRLFVQETVREEFTARLLEAVSRVKVGAGDEGGVTVGPVASEEQYSRILDYIDIGVAEGATVLAGGARVDRPGYFIAPTVFGGVEQSMRIAQEEIFGPVVGIQSFTSEEEVIELANSVEYGLAAGVWTSNLGRAHRVAAALETGTVWVNTYNVFDGALAFGGAKQSGFGRDLGDEGLEVFTELKNVVVVP
ncbi:aldehyde dehydrogenase family protein [Lacisediminihabitans profunda]|uniref:Aldehyde dehydrogenase n=1 Tax=Lacisediminihabitans profunda TaxID=2594790 RepID=A0A5C8UPN3_9MICO|nr:aldehyde dehydrogenase family protein [Lacisediminihabitans profunda]TXN30408.1 aldehyde dehydrogenase [Lacisediminihabitans profunda]